METRLNTVEKGFKSIWAEHAKLQLCLNKLDSIEKLDNFEVMLASLPWQAKCDQQRPLLYYCKPLRFKETHLLKK